MDTSSSCRIVVVSSTVEASKSLARRIKELSGDDTESDSSSEVLHWTIKNKYYTAPVHFHPIHVEGLESIELDDVPAVIYTWSEQEPFKEHVKKISEHISSYEPEVSLAINTAPSTEEELEDFFFEHGFEYIDGHNTEKRASTVGSPDSSDTPGIHRAIDALSTIMWPSMTRSESSRQSKLKTGIPLGVSPDIETTELDVLQLLNPDGSDHKAQKEREMALLEEWLNADVLDEDPGEDDDQDDYVSLSSHAHSTVQSDANDPWPTKTKVTPVESNREAQTRLGFDDDFAEFVSAPSQDTQKAHDNGDSDPELPSKDEIRAASARIFGPSSGLLSSSSNPFMGITSSDIRRTQSDTQEASDPATYLQLDDDEPTRALDMDGPAFDLSRILNALQEMKEEIALIPDEDERRKAAAKAALGLVYGLEEGGETSGN